MNELSEASRQLSQGFVTENDNLEAYRLLSQKNFDARKLQEEVKSIHLKVLV